jgi:uncharacterized protein (TIGR03435 family)
MQAASDRQSVAGSKTEFEVASIRPSKPGTNTPPNFGFDVWDGYGTRGDPHGRLSADLTLEGYIEFAYKIWPTRNQQAAMVSQLPKWVATEHFEIQAKAAGDPTKDQMRLMMQSLLADRFGLRVHFETRQVPVFILELEKPGTTGPQIRPHVDGSPCYLPVPPQTAGSPPTTDGISHPPCDVSSPPGLRFMPGNQIFLLSLDNTMKGLATALPSVGLLERPVVDQTGLSGKFDLALSWTWTLESDAAAPPGAGRDPGSSGPTFLEALKDQAGLKLKPAKAPMDILVIDHVEQPSPN